MRACRRRKALGLKRDLMITIIIMIIVLIITITIIINKYLPRMVVGARRSDSRRILKWAK